MSGNTTASHNPPVSVESPAPNHGWVVTFAALGINLVLGCLYAWGVLAKALVVQWKWSKTDASLPFTCSTAAFAITMIFAGRLQDRIGPSLVTLLGGLVLGAGLMASALATTPVQMALTFGVIGGIGIGLGYSATTPPAIKWFPPERKGLITGLVVSGVGIAAVYIGPLVEFLLTRNSIPRTFFILGAGTVVLVTLLSRLLSNPPQGYKPPQHEPTSAGSRPEAVTSGVEMDWHQMLGTPRFYVLWLMFVLSASAGLMMIAHAAIIAKEQAGLLWGFMPIAMLAIFNTAGRIVSGYVSDRIGRRYTMMLAFVLQAANMFIFTKYNTPALLLFGAAFTGLCYGGIFTLMPASTADAYGLKNLGVNYGILFTAFGVAGVFGPRVAGMIRDTQGTYATAFTMSGILLVIGAVLAFLASQSSAKPKTV